MTSLTPSGVCRWTARNPEMHRWQTGWKSWVESWNLPHPHDQRFQSHRQSRCRRYTSISAISRYLVDLCVWWKLETLLTKAIISCSFSLCCSSFVPWSKIYAEVNLLGWPWRLGGCHVECEPWHGTMNSWSRTDWDSRRSAELLLLQERANATLSTSGGISLPTAAAALKETSSVHQLGP